MRDTTRLSALVVRWLNLPLQHFVVYVMPIIPITLMLLHRYNGRSFFVSPKYLQTFFLPCIFVSYLIGALYIYSTYQLLAQLKISNTLRERGVLRKHVLEPVFFGTIFGIMPLTMGVPWLANMAIGKPYILTTTIQNIQKGVVILNCNRIYVGELENFWFGKLCVSKSNLNYLNKGDSITVDGSGSWFGIEFSRINIQKNQQSSDPHAIPLEHDQSGAK